MIIIWHRNSGLATYQGKTINVTCDIRNELNHRRTLDEKPVYTENKNGSVGSPYMPRPFPLGVWKVLAILPKKHEYEAPEFISTDAHQLVDVWSVVDGHYGENTHFQVSDFGYGWHNSTSMTTLGCGKIQRYDERAALTAAIRECWSRKEEVFINVKDD